jgi:drug/metabolite transporter (DMT)-like permease
MQYLWIASAIVAAFFQALRLAALKQLNQKLSIMATSYARVVFALPFLIGFQLAIMAASGQPPPASDLRFQAYSAAAAIFQFIGTTWTVRLFQLGSFAVGSMLSKTDVLMTAIFGSIFFAQVISLTGWIAIVVTLGGVMMIAAGRMPASGIRGARPGLGEIAFGPSTRIGLLSGGSFALSYLSIREAILALGPGVPPLMTSAYTATMMTAWSALLLGVWILLFERKSLRGIRQTLRLCLFLGVFSALGSSFWFFATALANAAYVAAVAQVQVIYTLAISWFYFRERIGWLELAGIIALVAGILLFRLV